MYRLKGELFFGKAAEALGPRQTERSRGVFLEGDRRRAKTRLRATTSLARLWPTMGMENEARKALTKI